ncbi:MAG: glycosyltransferase [Gammaproteobacteria bacterium]
MTNVHHFIGNPVSAKRFVEPLLLRLNREGYATEVIIDIVRGDALFAEHIQVKHRLAIFLFSLRPWILFAGVRNMYWHFLRNEIDVVHAHQTLSALLPLFFAWASNCPIRIYHNHGSVFRGAKGLIRFGLITLERVNCLLATHVIFVSAGLRRDFLDAKVLGKEKAFVIGAGSACGLEIPPHETTLSLEREQAIKRYVGIPVTDRVALYVGRSFKRKGFQFLVAWWQRENHNFPDLWLILAGCTPIDVAKVSETELPRLRALGYVENIDDYYKLSDFVLLPSESEGFSYAVLEAFLAKRAVIATDAPGLRDQIRQMETGLLFPIGSYLSLNKCVRELSSNSILKKRLEESALNYVKQFDRQVHLEQFVKFYRGITADKC